MKTQAILTINEDLGEELKIAALENDCATFMRTLFTHRATIDEQTFLNSILSPIESDSKLYLLMMYCDKHYSDMVGSDYYYELLKASIKLAKFPAVSAIYNHNKFYITEFDQYGESLLSITKDLDDKKHSAFKSEVMKLFSPQRQQELAEQDANKQERSFVEKELIKFRQKNKCEKAYYEAQSGKTTSKHTSFIQGLKDSSLVAESMTGDKLAARKLKRHLGYRGHTVSSAAKMVCKSGLQNDLFSGVQSRLKYNSMF